ncbi:MAG: tetratricopeptide repeat protein [Lentimicrobiaceae bacterium]|nr:tetratricopeptide repeat protein [Lentimicrobiaceae bacterium]
MTNRKYILVFLAAGAVLFAACQSKKEKLNAQIAEAEKQIFESYSAETMSQLVAFYQDYARAFPKDSLSAEYLFRAANGNRSLKKGAEALANFDAVIANYPDSRNVPECYFLRAFVYEDVLYDIENAVQAYYEFVSRFPSHELAITASINIAYLESGKSTNDIVASFEENELTEDFVE